ncbi:MAG TPA: 6-carboxytetrahydropterin synthase [Nitrososphaeraceae archaeon]|nr:6-carboxytetrahydropterin synthase [Nitrososphaeraceae archaeon]
MKRVVLDNDIKYIDSDGNLFRTRAELSISKMLSFLGQNFEYEVMLKFKNDDIVNVDFKIDDKYIEVIDSEDDVNKFLRIRRELPEIKIIAVGHSKYAGKVNELDSFFFFNSNYSQTGSIFIEDPSLAFDYAHILPLVEKCSILHGHTSTVMVEIIGDMKNNLIIDFGEAKRIIKETLSILDHKFFINTKYLKREDDIYYHISFEGPRGFFSLQLPKMTTFLLPGEATVENLSTEIIKLLAPKMPPTVEALGIYVYEGVNKGAHIIAEIKKVKG